MFEQFDDILTIEELAEALKIGTPQACKLVRSNKIPTFKEDKDWKIPRLERVLKLLVLICAFRFVG